MQTISGFWGVMAYVIGATFGNETLISAGVVIVLLFSVFPPLFIVEPKELETAHPNVERLPDAGTDWAQFTKICVAHGFSWIGVQTMFVYVIAYIQQKLVPGSLGAEAAADRSGQIISIAFAVLNTVGFLLPAFVLEPIAKRVGRVKTHTVSLAIMSVGYFLIASSARSSSMLYALMAVVGVGWSAIVSLPFAIMSEKVQKARMGLFMGLFNLSVVLPQLLVSLFLGRIIQSAADKSIIFVISGAMLGVSALLWVLVREEGTAPNEEPAPAHSTH
jgi:MFS family permease